MKSADVNSILCSGPE